MVARIFVVALLPLLACAQTLWAPIQTTRLSSEGELVEAPVPSRPLKTIRIEFAQGDGGRIRDFTVRYASGRVFRMPDPMIISTGTPVIVHIPRGEVVEVALKCDFAIAMAYGGVRIFPSISISGAER